MQSLCIWCFKVFGYRKKVSYLLDLLNLCYKCRYYLTCLLFQIYILGVDLLNNVRSGLQFCFYTALNTDKGSKLNDLRWKSNEVSDMLSLFRHWFLTSHWVIMIFFPRHWTTFMYTISHIMQYNKQKLIKFYLSVNNLRLTKKEMKISIILSLSLYI